jgi:hypothetical protein
VDFDKRYYEGASAHQNYNLKMFRRAETTFRDVVPVLEKRFCRSAESLIEIGAGRSLRIYRFGTSSGPPQMPSAWLASNRPASNSKTSI